MKMAACLSIRVQDLAQPMRQLRKSHPRQQVDASLHERNDGKGGVNERQRYIPERERSAEMQADREQASGADASDAGLTRADGVPKIGVPHLLTRSKTSADGRLELPLPGRRILTRTLSP